MNRDDREQSDARHALWRHDWVLAGLCGVLYFVAARLAIAFVVQPEGIAVIWPASGVLLGFLLFSPRRSWAAILFVVFVVVTFVNLVIGISAVLSLGFAFGNCLGPTVAAVVMLRVVGRLPRMDESRDVYALIFVSTISPALTAIVAAEIVQRGTGAPFWPVWLIWWLEDVMGLLVVTPLMLLAHRLVAARALRWPKLETGAVVGGIGMMASSIWVFLLPPRLTTAYFAQPYLPVPFVGYLALRFGPVGTVVSNACVTIAVLTGLAYDVGAFETIATSNRDQALGAQLFLAVTCVTTLIAGAVAAERRRIEASLRFSQASLAEAQSVARLGSWRVEFTPGGDRWTVSDELNRIWGDLPGTDVTMSKAFSRIHPDDRSGVAEAWAAAIHAEGPSQWDQRILVEGQEKWIEVHARVESDQVGLPFAMSGTHQDITERKRTETELRAAEAKYRLVTENASDVIWLMDFETQRFVYVSPSVTLLRGYSPEEVMAQPVSHSLTHELQERVADAVVGNLPPFLAGAASGGPFVGLVDQPTKDGGIVQTEVTTRYVRDEATGRVYVVGVSRDVSERQQTESLLKQLASEQATVLNTVPAAIWCVVGRTIVWSNPAIEDLFGYPAAETIGMDTAAFYLNRTIYDDVGRSGYSVMARGESYSCEVEMKRRTGEAVWCHLAGRYVEPGGPEKGAIWVIQDITARKRAEEKLRSFGEAQRALLREVNHRVKNNLSALLGMVHLEQDRAVSAGHTGTERAMHDLDARLRSLATVHAMLSLSEWRPVRLDDLCSRIISSVLGASASHLRRVHVSDSPVVVDANQAHNLALVLSELATNTLKYGADPERPSIRVTIEKADGSVYLTYHDEGPGFPAAVLEEVGGASRVGLELMRGLVHQSLRGRLTLSNDGGAVVKVQFPLAGQGED